MKTGYLPAVWQPDRQLLHCNGRSVQRRADCPARSSSKRRLSERGRPQDKDFEAICSYNGCSAPIPGEPRGRSLGRTWQLSLRILIKGKGQGAKCKGQKAKGQKAKCKEQNAKGKRQRGKGQNARSKMQGAKCKGQNAKGKMQGANIYRVAIFALCPLPFIARGSACTTAR